MGIEMENLKLLNLVDMCIKKHQKVFQEQKMRWDKGDITGIWRDSDGSVRISYEDGQWFHYREEDGEIVWI